MVMILSILLEMIQNFKFHTFLKDYQIYFTEQREFYQQIPTYSLGQKNIFFKIKYLKIKEIRRYC